jgi:hypothetical protein
MTMSLKNNINKKTRNIKRPQSRWIISFVVLLTACTPMAGVINTTPTFPTEIHAPPDTKSPSTDTLLPTYSDPVDRLIAIMEVSDPASPTYHPGSAAYVEFPDTLKQLAALNASTNNAASMLAYALGFPRQDSILAAQALISLGPSWAATDLPTLIVYLSDPRPNIRMYSAIVLSITGKNGSCSLGNIGPLLWDADPYVRSSAALAIQGITGKELVANIYAITPDHLTSNPVAADTPDGKIVGAARKWWTDQGSKVNWHPNYDLCDP